MSLHIAAMGMVSREHVVSALSVCRQDFHAVYGLSQLAETGSRVEVSGLTQVEIGV